MMLHNFSITGHISGVRDNNVAKSIIYTNADGNKIWSIRLKGNEKPIPLKDDFF